MNKLFLDAGIKLRMISKILFFLGTIGAILWGITIFDDWGYRWLYSIFIWVGVPLSLYVNCLFLCTIADIAEGVRYSK